MRRLSRKISRVFQAQQLGSEPPREITSIQQTEHQVQEHTEPIRIVQVDQDMRIALTLPLCIHPYIDLEPQIEKSTMQHPLHQAQEPMHPRLISALTEKATLSHQEGLRMSITGLPVQAPMRYPTRQMAQASRKDFISVHILTLQSMGSTSKGNFFKEAEKTPGPGTYNFDKTSVSSPMYTFGSKSPEKTTDFTPGPGAYDRTTQQEGPSYTFRGRAREVFRETAPGPGAYNAQMSSPTGKSAL